ncbi:hypothetical protein COCNU_06G016400 [Cocos nucifera]|uniref:Methyltransferase n=1 Tax=Cocos nucifera TaxID=13894 RepID=A0A8K0N3M3_COCNU|nr:hypothetical protein COCNU_06G016400 [Cocos nucifera]
MIAGRFGSSWLGRLIRVVGLVYSERGGDLDAASWNSIGQSPVPYIYRNYRRLREQTTSDLLEIQALSFGITPLGVLQFCGRERDNSVPCYNVSANLLAGFHDGDEVDRHCEVDDVKTGCLVRPPKDYKIPLRWPAGKDIIWSGNVKITKDQFLSSGSMKKRMMLLEDNQIAFHSEDAAYEVFGSQVQLTLERGLPAIIGNFVSRQLPYPSLSFDMVHCAQCGIIWDKKDGAFLIEVDRLLKPGGYFVLTSATSKGQGEQDETFIWQKTADFNCYASRCEPFPTYPRTYDLLHATGLLSHYLTLEKCGLSALLLEMDRILRPEGWIVLHDKVQVIEKARALVTQIRWDARVIESQNDGDQRLLICQKPFLRK